MDILIFRFVVLVGRSTIFFLGFVVSMLKIWGCHKGYAVRLHFFVELSLEVPFSCVALTRVRPARFNCFVKCGFVQVAIYETAILVQMVSGIINFYLFLGMSCYPKSPK